MNIFSFLLVFRYPGAYKPFLILLVTFMLQQLTGKLHEGNEDNEVENKASPLVVLAVTSLIV